VTGGLVVSGRIEMREPWLAELVPDAPLTPLTTYRMELTRDVRDLDGDPLEDAVTAEFTTHAGPPVSLSRMRIAFVSSRDGFDRIYLVNGDGSGLVPLTAGTGPAWSWDDQRIAFHRETPDGPVIGVINADGTGERVVGPGANPAWSPDGRLAFVSSHEGDGGIAVMNADGTGHTLLLSHDFTYTGCKPPTSIYAWWGDCVTSPQWSPDGRRIAFFSGDVGYTGAEVYVMNADGSSPIRLTPARAWSARQPTWAPDGARVAFAWGGPTSAIAAISLDGSGTMTALASGNDPSWSPDGRWIAHMEDAGPLRITATNVVTGEYYGRLIPEAQAPPNPDYYDSDAEWGHTIR
jgi:Tol biopolymer transport system component